MDGQSGEEQQTCANEDLYRIIGLFKNEDEYEMKLIKADFATEEQLGTGGARNVSSSYNGTLPFFSSYKGELEQIPTYYWASSDNQSNLWKDSTLNNTNLNGTFLTKLEQKLGATDEIIPITTHDWTTAGNAWSSIGTQTVATAYNNEIKEPNRGSNGTDEDNTTQAKIGLMYVSDYGYATSPENWKTMLNGGVEGKDYRLENVRNNNWMYMGLYEWTITRCADRLDGALYIVYTGYVSVIDVYAHSIALRPCFYLKSETRIASGNGSKESPYRITWEGQD